MEALKLLNSSKNEEDDIPKEEELECSEYWAGHDDIASAYNTILTLEYTGDVGLYPNAKKQKEKFQEMREIAYDIIYFRIKQIHRSLYE